MFPTREVRVPATWCLSSNQKSPQSAKIKESIIEWCVETGVASRSLAQKAVAQLSPVYYMNILFPKVDPSNPSVAKLYEINAALIVAGYTVDDVLETYTLKALQELDNFFRSTEAWVSSLKPDKYPTLKELSESLPELSVPYSRAVICMFIDNFNKYSHEIWSNIVPLSQVQTFRRRLSASVTAYLKMAMAKKQNDGKIDEKEFLWRRSADNLGFPVLMLSEVVSGLLKDQCKSISATRLHYFHMYSNLFAHVLNDLNSYHRDIHTEHNSLVKLWLQAGIASDIDDAGSKIVEFLNSAIINIHRSVETIQAEHPNCVALSNFVESISYTFAGWVHVHTTAVERYKLSPFQITLRKVEEEDVQQWLQNETEFGRRCVRMFDELMQEREKEMVLIYGLN
nr:TPS6 [Erythropodium caribaeorum]